MGRYKARCTLVSGHLALYLTHLSESVGSKVVVEEAVHVLVWMHRVAGLRPVGGVPTGAGDSPGFEMVVG